MEPINYQLQVANPFDSGLKGFAQGLQMSQAVEQTQLKKAQMQQQLQMQKDMFALANNPNATAQDYARMMTAYPQLSEQYKRSWEVLNADQQQSMLSDGLKLDAALQSGQYDIAKQFIEQKAQAYENSGNAKEAAHWKAFGQILENDPTKHKGIAKQFITAPLIAQMGPEKYASLRSEQRTAENAPIKTSLENAKTAEEIKTAQLKRQIDSLDVQIRQANSETQRGELQLKRDELNQKLQQTQQGQQADSQNQLDTVGNSLDTVNKLLNHNVLTSSIGVGSTIGKALGIVPGTDNKDFNALLDTLKSQQFLTAAKEMKGMGALSDAEGARIERAVASLDRDQSPQAFKTALTTIKSTLERAQAKIVASGKLPTSNGAFVMQHPMYGQVTDGVINKLLAQFPGSTRDQVLAYLRSTGGK